MSIAIVDFTPEVKPNEYDETVAQLIAAGEGKAVQLTVELGEEGKTAAKHKRLFAQAANAAGKTAKSRGAVEDGKGNVTLTFTLAERQTRTRKVDAEAETVEDTNS